MRNWFQLTQEENNNAIGSYFIARQRMAEGIKYQVEQNKLEVNLGRGFLNLKKCVKYSSTKKDLNTGKPECEKWETTTPGAEVQASLDRLMGSKTHRIEIATNFNQIISALVNQVMIQAVNGLRGGNSYSNNNSYNYTNPVYDTYDEYQAPIQNISTTTSTTSTSTKDYRFDSGYGIN